nr:hypothetical protein [Legionella jordanis]
MRKNNGFFSSKKIDVYVEPGAMEQLPPAMQEAILNRQKQKPSNPTITMLTQQLNDPAMPEAYKKRLQDLISKLENQEPEAPNSGPPL